MRHVIYFHGFASGTNSSKVLELRKNYDNVFAPCVPYCFSPEVLVEQINGYLTRNSKVGDSVLFVGTSLGGYWATLMAKLFDGMAVVFNPSVDPAKDLEKYLGENTNYSSGSTFTLDKKYIESFEPLVKESIENVAYAVICTKDVEVDTKKSIELFDDAVYVVSDDHQFKNMDMFMKYVNLGFDKIKPDNVWNGDF